MNERLIGHYKEATEARYFQECITSLLSHYHHNLKGKCGGFRIFFETLNQINPTGIAIMPSEL